MRENHVAGIARSNYRQLRLTATLESNGRLSYRLHAKGLADSWSERHLVALGQVVHREQINTTEDAVAAVIAVLCADNLLLMP